MILVFEKTLREGLRMKVRNIASTTNAEASARVPPAMRENTPARDPKTIRLLVVVAVIKLLNAEIKNIKEKYAHPEGLVLAIKNTPSGTEVINRVTNGALLA
jgi:hypothetical protein